jgi:transcriptional regulator with XRE-family HTH domain
LPFKNLSGAALLEDLFVAVVATKAREQSPALEALRVNLIVARAKARLSQAELAERSGVSRPTISRIERAASDVSILVVQRLADVFGLSVAELFSKPQSAAASEAEIEKRAHAGDNEYVSARDLFAAIDEAGEEGIQRYSHAGRRAAVARRPAQKRR